jgi:hypothetical protein
MLYNPKAQRSASVTSLAPRAMSGRRLNRLVKKGSPRDRASLALDLERGAVQLIRTTRAQAAVLTKASTGYIGTLARLSEDERRQVARGETSISHLLKLSRLHNGRRDLDAGIDRFIQRVGVERVWAAIERYTQPGLFPAE